METGGDFAALFSIRSSDYHVTPALPRAVSNTPFIRPDRVLLIFDSIGAIGPLPRSARSFWPLPRSVSGSTASLAQLGPRRARPAGQYSRWPNAAAAQSAGAFSPLVQGCCPAFAVSENRCFDQDSINSTNKPSFIYGTGPV